MMIFLPIFWKLLPPRWKLKKTAPYFSIYWWKRSELFFLVFYIFIVFIFAHTLVKLIFRNNVFQIKFWTILKVNQMLRCTPVRECNRFGLWGFLCSVSFQIGSLMNYFIPTQFRFCCTLRLDFRRQASIW